jgi:hypothetical protein
MKQFRIIDEAVFTYSERDQLFLMLIRIGEKYCIEINSRASMIGRMMARSRKEAEAMFVQTEKKLHSNTDIDSISKTLSIGFAMNAVRPCMFIINLMDTQVEFNEIWKFKQVYGCQTNPGITDLIFEDKAYNHTIEILFPGYSIPIGKFIAPHSEAKFTFEINEAFLNQK